MVSTLENRPLDAKFGALGAALLRTSGSVDLRGPMKNRDLPAVFQSADVFCAPSLYDARPNVRRAEQLVTERCLAHRL